MSLPSQVGLAVGDIESVQKYAFLRNKGKFIDFVFGVERHFPRCITRRFHKPQLVVTGRYVDRKISAGYVSGCGWLGIQRYQLVKSPLQLQFLASAKNLVFLTNVNCPERIHSLYLDSMYVKP